MLTPQRKPTLHSDLLKRFYSEVTVDIEYQSDKIRRTHLLDRLGISRTYAVTHFHPLNWTDEIQQIAAVIKAGKSIGETFRSYGYSIHKERICTIKVRTSERLRKRFATPDTKGTLHQYAFSVSRNDAPLVHFATITEIYPPGLSDILEQEQLLSLTHNTTPRYASDFANDIAL